MKKYLLPAADDKIKYYKSNLHCHSTFSDGNKTPAQIKEFYMAHGYSVVAFTDHNVFITHNELTDDKFVAMNGVELYACDENDPNGLRKQKTTHICYVALDPTMDLCPCWHRSKYVFGKSAEYRDMVLFDKNEPDFERSHSGECISKMMKKGADMGFFVTYNHPAWSLENYSDYMNYDNMHAMEITNYGSVLDGYDEYNGRCYDDMLRGGKQIYCIGTDDNHNAHSDDSELCDSFGGYVMIAASELTYESIAQSLKDGLFYTSSGNSKHIGPEILSLTFDDGKVKIETSAAKRISLMTDCRRNETLTAKEYGFLRCAEFNVSDDVEYFRIEVTDSCGYKAYTNAYFLPVK